MLAWCAAALEDLGRQGALQLLLIVKQSSALKSSAKGWFGAAL